MLLNGVIKMKKIIVNDAEYELIKDYKNTFIYNIAVDMLLIFCIYIIYRLFI